MKRSEVYRMKSVFPFVFLIGTMLCSIGCGSRSTDEGLALKLIDSLEPGTIQSRKAYLELRVAGSKYWPYLRRSAFEQRRPDGVRALCMSVLLETKDVQSVPRIEQFIKQATIEPGNRATLLYPYNEYLGEASIPILEKCYNEGPAIFKHVCNTIYKEHASNPAYAKSYRQLQNRHSNSGR